ncbi:unnamed protein product [Fusarium graminearum]|nr:unnamed protein product [Fusarium graminearum]
MNNLTYSNPFSVPFVSPSRIAATIPPRTAPIPPGQHKLSALFESKTTATSGVPTNRSTGRRASTESPTGLKIDSDSLPRFGDGFQTYSVCITD